MYPDLKSVEIIDLSEFEEAADSSETISLLSDNELMDVADELAEILRAENKLFANGKVQRMVPCLPTSANNQACSGSSSQSHKSNVNQADSTSNHQPYQLNSCGQVYNECNNPYGTGAQVYNGSSSQPPPYTKGQDFKSRAPAMTTMDPEIIRLPPLKLAQSTVLFARDAQYPMITPVMPAPSVRPIAPISIGPIPPVAPIVAPMLPPKAQSFQSQPPPVPSKAQALKSQPLQLSSNIQAAIHSSEHHNSEAITNREGQHEKVSLQLLVTKEGQTKKLLVTTEGQTKKLRLEPLANKEQTEIIYYGPLPFEEVYCIPNDKHLEQLLDGKVYFVPNTHHLEQLPGVWQEDVSSKQMSD